MTYDWNTMVDITVPPGTNGWLYSGEVIINGVKVKFPVGTPTTVPEPAAALLNKMIELEKEDDLNTARPNNHYIGDVTIPEGKTLTIMKGAKVVDEAGVLDSGASGSAPVVILPETVLTPVEMDGVVVGFSGTPTLTMYPEVGKTYTVIVNGTEYVLLAVDVEGLIGFMDANETFGIMVAPPELAAEHGMSVMVEWFSEDVPDPFTLSIVLKEDNASSGGNAGGGGFVVNGVVEMDGDVPIIASVDKSLAEVSAAYNAGHIVQMRLNAPALGMNYVLPLTIFVDGEMAAFQGLQSDSLASAYMIGDVVDYQLQKLVTES